MAVPKIKELRALPDESLIDAHDNKAKDTEAGVAYYLDELARRDQSRQTEAMLAYTRWIIVMTAVVTLATIANPVIAYLMFRKV
jgi:hypothetical protein